MTSYTEIKYNSNHIKNIDDNIHFQNSYWIINTLGTQIMTQINRLNTQFNKI